MSAKIGDRVIALESLKDGICKTYGEGTYQGKVVPADDGLFEQHNIKNPCILLDNGKYVWGYQCWWGGVEGFKKIYGEKIKEEVIVEVSNEVKPKEESLL